MNVSIQTGHGEVEAVVTEVGSEPQISSQSQPSQQFPGESSSLLWRGRRQRLEKTLLYCRLIGGSNPSQHLPGLLNSPSTDEPPRE